MLIFKKLNFLKARQTEGAQNPSVYPELSFKESLFRFESKASSNPKAESPWGEDSEAIVKHLFYFEIKIYF